jgi:NAD(P)-dependent dehydrogenase (short-subunit alcohol dehydrogenase family)
VRAAAAQVLAQGPLDLVCYCAGTYQDLRATGFDLDTMLQHTAVNYTGALHVLDAVLPTLLASAAAGRPGHLSLVSSVAGFRGLPKGLAYGPTKAALTHLAETLYLDLHDLGLGVSVVHPGFVDTPLTASNDFRMPALITPATAAAAHAARLGARCIQYPLPPALHLGHAAAAPAALPVVLCGRAPLYWTVMTPACLPPEEAITRLVRCFEHLQPDTVAELGRLYAPDARFKDPFNEVQGVPAIEAIFQHMFGALEQPRFVVTGQVVQGAQCFLTWDFCFAMRNVRPGVEQKIRGATHLVLNDQGQIALHRDYWDAAEELYEKLPVLGALMRWLKRRARS